jgi:GDPmannose 4,6-dehydratase
MKSALICGVSGQDGAYLARLLLQKGYRVVGTSRDAQMSSFNNLQRLGIHGDVETVSMAPTDFRSVLSVISRVEPQEIYNLSGQSSVGLSFEQPVETMESIAIGTLNLLEVIRFLSRDIRFYNAGSCECFGDTVSTTASEATLFSPRSPYAVAKSAAHWQVANYREAYGLKACTGILSNHESPLRPGRFVTKKICDAAKRMSVNSSEKLVLGNTTIIRDWGWAPEYVEAMWMMLQAHTVEDFVIATGRSVSLEVFLDLAFKEAGLEWRDHVEIHRDLFRPSDIQQSRANPAMAESKLGWKAKYDVGDVVRKMMSGSLV